MSLVLYRVCKWKYARAKNLNDHAYGAARFGGRWNSQDEALRFDRRIIYAADTLAQAMLEVIVHSDRLALQLVAHAAIRFRVNENFVASLDISHLPDSWNAHPSTSASQVIGDEWFDTFVSPVLRVPSVILPVSMFGANHSNYLINIRHPEIKKAVTLLGAEPLQFDKRL